MGYKPIVLHSGRKVFGVRVVCYKTGSQGHVFTLSIGENVGEKMGWQHGTRVEMALGDGKQAGWLRLKANEDGYLLFKVGKGGLTLNVSLKRLADDQSHPREAAAYKINRGALYVKLPKWANT